MENYTFPLPWPPPISIYDNDGPRDREDVTFTIRAGDEDVTMRVSPTKMVGCDTLRNRFTVECLTCGIEIHRATTGAGSRCEYHLKQHAEKDKNLTTGYKKIGSGRGGFD